MESLAELAKNPGVVLAALCVRMTVEMLRRLFRVRDEAGTQVIVYAASAGYAWLWHLDLLKAFTVTSGIPLVDLAANAALLGYFTMIGHDVLDKLAGK